jgi:hypothetical protein
MAKTTASAQVASVSADVSEDNRCKKQRDDHQQSDAKSIMTGALIQIIGYYVDPVMAGPLLNDDTPLNPALENPPLKMTCRIEGNRPIRAHSILAEKLVLNIPPSFRY